MQKSGTIPIIWDILDKQPVIPSSHAIISALVYNCWNADDQLIFFLTFWTSNFLSNLRVLFVRYTAYGRSGLNKKLKELNNKTNSMMPNCYSAFVFVDIIHSRETLFNVRAKRWFERYIAKPICLLKFLFPV